MTSIAPIEQTEADWALEAAEKGMNLNEISKTTPQGLKPVIIFLHLRHD
jgi:hypothetical protein